MPIDNPIEKLPEINFKVFNIIDLAKTIFPNEQSINLPREMAESVSNLNQRIEIFSNFGIVDGVEKFEGALNAADGIGIFATVLGQQGGKLLPNDPNIVGFNALYDAGRELRSFIGNLQVVVSGVISGGNGPILPEIALQKNWKLLEKQFMEYANSFQAKLEVAEDELSRHELRVQAFGDLLGDNLIKFESTTTDMSQRISSALSDAEMKATKQGFALENQYKTTILGLKNKEDEVAKLLGNFASAVLAGGYARSAAYEQKSANTFRTLSVGLMVVVVLILTFTLYELSSAGLGWKETVLRLVISVLLSVPIGYLARESSRHRGQHYLHLQTSLDISAVGPFIESLSPEVREKIKSNIAEKIFFQNGKNEQIIDSYGIDVQALMMKLLDKMEISKSKD